MKVLGVIPARYASSRFPGKPLIDLNGKTMIRRVYEGAGRSGMINELVVATDDQRIFDEVKSFGGKVRMTGEHHPSGTDRCAEVLTDYPDVDVVINIQGDEPLVDHRQIDQLLEAFRDPSVKIATLGIRDVHPDDLTNVNRIKIVVGHDHSALYFSRSCIPNHAHTKTDDPLRVYPYLRHIGLYAYRAEVLRELTKLEPTHLERTESLEQLRWLYYGYPIKVVETTIETPNIDVPTDVEKVLQFL
jgi:3-deoxy-manno-octulosonate cytidylyltransferase (CMP-KDO synthetase)